MGGLDPGDRLDGPRPPRLRLRAATPLPEALDTPTVNVVVKPLHDRAVLAEPMVSAHIKELVADVGAALAGFDKRLKEVGSLVRKVEDDVVIRNISYEAATHGIHDALRYTVVINPEDFAAGVEEILQGLRDRDYTVDPERTWNFFIANNRYKGVHAVAIVTAPDGEPLALEIQFHTRASLSVKSATHDLYRIYRDLSVPLLNRRDAYDALVAASRLIHHPPHVAGIGKLKPTRRPVA